MDPHGAPSAVANSFFCFFCFCFVDLPLVCTGFIALFLSQVEEGQSQKEEKDEKEEEGEGPTGWHQQQ